MATYSLQNIPAGYDKKEIENWTDGTEVLCSGLSKDGGCFYVVTRDEEMPHLGYGLLRFFLLSGRTVCSADISDQEKDEFLAIILEKFVGDMMPAEEVIDDDDEELTA